MYTDTYEPQQHEMTGPSWVASKNRMPIVKSTERRYSNGLTADEIQALGLERRIAILTSIRYKQGDEFPFSGVDIKLRYFDDLTKSHNGMPYQLSNEDVEGLGLTGDCHGSFIGDFEGQEIGVYAFPKEHFIFGLDFDVPVK